MSVFASKKPVIIAVDDTHSAGVEVTMLIRALLATPDVYVIVVAAGDGAQLANQTADRADRQSFGALCRHTAAGHRQQFHVHGIEPLTDEEAGLLAHAVGLTSPAESARAVFRAAGSVALLAAMVSTRDPTVPLTPANATQNPCWRYLEDHRERADVPDTAWAMVELLASTGQSAALLSQLEAVTGTDTTTAAGYVDALAVEGILQVDPQGTVCFRAPIHQAFAAELAATSFIDAATRQRVQQVFARRTLSNPAEIRAAAVRSCGLYARVIECSTVIQPLTIRWSRTTNVGSAGSGPVDVALEQLAFARRRLDDNSAELASMLWNLAQVTAGVKEWDAAVAFAEQALAIYTTRAEVPEWLLDDAGTLQFHAGRSAAAARQLEQLAWRRTDRLGADHPDTLTVRNNLAAAYHAAGRAREAIELEERVLADIERVLGADHPDTFTARGNLAASYQAAGRTGEAIELQERVLADRERVLGADHPDTFTARGNLAASYQAAGRTGEAIELEERVLADMERVLGADHPDTFAARNNLAASYQAAGRTGEAIELKERVLADMERVLGPDHPATFTARNNLAGSYLAAGRTGEAIELQERVLADRERVLGADHPATFTARNNLAGSYRAAGRAREAIELQERVLADIERVLGADHPDTFTAHNNLAGSYQAAGRTGEAIELKERVLADRERMLGADHPATFTARNNLAASYQAAGRTGEAIELQERVLADRERVLGADHPDTFTARGNLAVSYHAAGRASEAIELEERVLADIERVLGADHPDTFTARNNLATSYHEAGRTGEAIELEERVLADIERVLGADHPDTFTARNNLATMKRGSASA